MSKSKKVHQAGSLLTVKQQRQYLVHGGSRCPWCQGQDIEGTGHSNSDGDWHENEIQCNACGALWLDIYTISGIQAISGPTRNSAPCILVQHVHKQRAQGTCDGRPWEAWVEDGRWRVAGHGWYAVQEADPIIRAIRRQIDQRRAVQKESGRPAHSRGAVHIRKHHEGGFTCEREQATPTTPP